MNDKKDFVSADKIHIMEESHEGGIHLDGRFNPRGLDNDGFFEEKMELLRTDIKNKGLNSPLLVREVNGVYWLLAGERRLRCILRLLEDDELCFNPLTDKFERASEIYLKRGVEVKIKNCKSEIDYLCVSIGENVLHEPLTDFDLLLQTVRLEQAGICRKDQASTMHKSEAWISQSHSILKLGPAILEQLKNGNLPRTAAIDFLELPPEQHDSVLKLAIRKVQALADEKITEAETEKTTAIKEIDAGNATISVATFLGSAEGQRKGKKIVSESYRKINRADKKISSARRERGRLSDSAIVDAAREAGNKLKRPRAPKELRGFIEYIEKRVKEEGKDNFLEHNGKPVSLKKITLLINVFNFVLNLRECEDPLDLLAAKTC